MFVIVVTPSTKSSTRRVFIRTTKLSRIHYLYFDLSTTRRYIDILYLVKDVCTERSFDVPR